MTKTPPPDAYISILEAPLDRYSVPDVGDHLSLAAGHNAFGHALMGRELLKDLSPAALRAAKKPPTPIVPYTRPISLGTYGKDVQGAKRAIWKANSLGIPKAPTKTFGPISVKQLKAFQKAHALPADGVLGPTTLRVLGPFFDAYAFLLYTGYPPTGSKEQKLRAAMVAYALWGYNNRAEIHYAEFRPMLYLNALETLPVSEDCSTFATKDYKYAGAADPNGLNYDGYGNTGTMREHGIVIPLAQALPGDLAHYDNPQHVAIYVGNGRVISHGSEIGPLLSPVDYRPLTEIRTYLDGVAT